MTDALVAFIKNALQEDIGKGDYTSLATIPPCQLGKATFYVKEKCIIAGVDLARLICQEVDDQLVVQFEINDGQFIEAPTAIGSISGSIPVSYTHLTLPTKRIV